MDNLEAVLPNPLHFLIPPQVITSINQLPPFNSTIPSLQWSPCVIDAILQIPFNLSVNDLYIKTLVLYFLNKNTICSDELCKTISFCHPLWLALHVSNYIKTDINSTYSCRNKYIHPILSYNHLRHILQHQSNNQI
jgi:hypothetical protein